MSKRNQSFWLSPRGVVALVFIAFLTYFLVMEHREHIFQFLPYLIILLCPLMHLFMHRGHGHHHNSEQDNPHDSFKEKTERNKAYRDGYIEGLKAGRQAPEHKENSNGR